MADPFIRSSPETWAEAERLLRGATRILAMAHVSPDGDAIGSLLGFSHAMRSLGKHVQAVIQDKPHNRFDYLPGVHDIRQRASGAFDVIVALDAGDRQRLGAAFDPAQHDATPLINFDHHITNTYFGTVNVIETGMASTSELVIRLMKQMGITPTPDIAMALLTGIITDTLAFRTSNTTADTLAAAMEMMRHGASLMEITRNALVLRSMDQIRLQGAGIMAAHIENRLAYATIPRKLRKEIGSREERGDGGLIGTLITAYEVDIAAVFVELASGDIEIGFRAAPGFDVSQVAVTLGGGGHPAAAGCALPGPMRDAVNRVLPLLRDAVKKQ